MIGFATGAMTGTGGAGGAVKTLGGNVTGFAGSAAATTTGGFAGVAKEATGSLPGGVVVEEDPGAHPSDPGPAVATAGCCGVVAGGDPKTIGARGVGIDTAGTGAGIGGAGGTAALGGTGKAGWLTSTQSPEGKVNFGALHPNSKAAQSSSLATSLHFMTSTFV